MIELEEQENLGLVNVENYGPLASYPSSQPTVINTDDINIDTWDSYYFGIFNILKDGIEEDIIRKKKIRVVFGKTGYACNLFITDLLVNIEMWYALVYLNDPILPCHVIKGDDITDKDIKEFIDRFIILKHRNKIPFKLLNNIIDDTLCNWYYINYFYSYLADSLNLKDFVDLARKNKQYNSLLHSDLSSYPIDEVNKIALEKTEAMIDIERKSREILGYDHCMVNSHRAGQSPKKQLKEGFIYIGPKPDGCGNVYPHSINHSYINGGVGDISDFFVSSAVARTAQIISHNNVGSSGGFARLLGLNNSGTLISKTVDKCDTHRLIKITLKTKRHVEMYFERWCKTELDGVDKFIELDDYSWLGKTIYVYSPITCNLNSHKHMICHHCYGSLYIINMYINAGKISSEILSAILTQWLLSAKHILEAKVIALVWPQIFYKFFTTEYNYIMLLESDEDKEEYILIDPNDIELDEGEDYIDEEDTSNGVEYINSFYLVSNGEKFEIKNQDSRTLYISNTLNGIIRKYAAEEDGMIKIPFKMIPEKSPLFYLRLTNNEIGRTLSKLMNLIDKKNRRNNFTVDDMVQEFIDTVVEGNLNIRSIHCEVILSNQIHNAIDWAKPIDWSDENALYKLVSLKEALLNNPSPTVTLMFQSLAMVLYTPLTYRKNAPSFLDLFFMKKPQDFINRNFINRVIDSEDDDSCPFHIELNPREVKD